MREQNNGFDALCELMNIVPVDAVLHIESARKNVSSSEWVSCEDEGELWLFTDWEIDSDPAVVIREKDIDNVRVVIGSFVVVTLKGGEEIAVYWEDENGFLAVA